MKKKQNKVVQKVVNAGKIVVAGAAGLVGIEVFASGTRAVVQDAKFIGKCINKPVYKVKEKGLFKKAVLVTENPFTGKCTKYVGTKKPVNQKVIKVAKIMWK